MLTVDDIKKETNFEIDSFNRGQEFSKLESIARRLRTLILSEKGTNPNNSDIGVGIEMYLMDIMSPSLISEITSEIQQQIVKYFEEKELIKSIKIENLENKYQNFEKTLGIMIYLTEEVDDKDRMILLFSKNENEIKVVEKLIL